MNAMFKTRRRLALGAAALIVTVAMGYSAARARGPDGQEADRRQVAAIVAERDRALADLADARMRLRLTRRVIERYAEELSYVDHLNARLQREAGARHAGGRSGLPATGPMQ